MGRDGDEEYVQEREHILQMYRWGKWHKGQLEFAGVKLTQHADKVIYLDMEEYTEKFITEMGDKFRGRKDDEQASEREVSIMRGVLGTCQWRAQQQAPQYAAE
eukprot:92645-Alexandrium_andersonii.AAC.1